MNICAIVLNDIQMYINGYRKWYSILHKTFGFKTDNQTF